MTETSKLDVIFSHGYFMATPKSNGYAKYEGVYGYTTID